MSNEEELIYENLIFLDRLDLKILPTSHTTPSQLLRLMTKFRLINSNGSTIAFWAALLGNNQFNSSSHDLNELYEYLK